MSHELTQTAGGHAAFVDDQTGNRGLHLAANARIKTTLMFSISRTAPGAPTGLGGDTTVTIPGSAVPTDIRYFSAAGDSQTGATITIGLDNTTSNYFLSTTNVSDFSGQQIPTAAKNLFTALPIMPVGTPHTIVGHYSQAGTSATGGPWYFEIDYYLPVPA